MILLLQSCSSGNMFDGALSSLCMNKKKVDEMRRPPAELCDDQYTLGLSSIETRTDCDDGGMLLLCLPARPPALALLRASAW